MISQIDKTELLERFLHYVSFSPNQNLMRSIPQLSRANEVSHAVTKRINPTWFGEC